MKMQLAYHTRSLPSVGDTISIEFLGETARFEVKRMVWGGEYVELDLAPLGTAAEAIDYVPVEGSTR